MRPSVFVASFALVAACGHRDDLPAGSGASAHASDRPGDASTTQASRGLMLTISSPAFQDGHTIPATHTCDGANRSPALSWRGAPGGAASHVLLVEDPDAPRGTFIHWVLYDLPGSQSSLPEGLPKDGELAQLGGARQGTTSFGTTGYGGPCPPPGSAHHYHFRLFALDRKLALPAGASYADVTAAMRGHEVGQGEIVGLYARKK